MFRHIYIKFDVTTVIILIKIVSYVYSLNLYCWTFTVAEKSTSTS